MKTPMYPSRAALVEEGHSREVVEAAPGVFIIFISCVKFMSKVHSLKEGLPHDFEHFLNQSPT